MPRLAQIPHKIMSPERLTSLGIMSSTLGQELMQPLSVLQLSLQNSIHELESMNSPKPVLDDLKRCLEACAAVTSRVRRFRDMVQPPGRKRIVRVNISRVVGKTFRLLEQSSTQARISLRSKNLEKLPNLRMPESYLDRVFFMLCQNAVQAADGLKVHHLTVSGSLNDNWLSILFKDDCGGIEPAYIPRIFKPFFTTRLPGEGMGLGLYISQEIVSGLGGRIELENRPAEGTTFIVKLPLKVKLSMLWKG